MARLLGAAEEIAKSAGAPVYNDYRPDRSLYERAISAGRSNLGEQAFEGARSEGWSLAFADDAVELLTESP